MFGHIPMLSDGDTRQMQSLQRRYRLGLADVSSPLVSWELEQFQLRPKPKGIPIIREQRVDETKKIE